MAPFQQVFIPTGCCAMSITPHYTISAHALVHPTQDQTFSCFLSDTFVFFRSWEFAFGTADIFRPLLLFFLELIFILAFVFNRASIYLFDKIPVGDISNIHVTTTLRSHTYDITLVVALLIVEIYNKVPCRLFVIV